MIKRILCLSLAVLFCLTLLVGCKKKTDPNADTTAPGETSDTTPTEQTLNDADTLGEYDFGGVTYRILVRTETNYEHNPTNTKGITSVNNEIFNRNASVEDRFNVKIAFIEMGGSWGNNLLDTKLMQAYQTYNQSGIAGAHLVTDHFSMLQRAAIQGWSMDMTQLATVDMAKEWWCEQFYENCNIGGKFYTAVGDIAYTLYEYMQVVFFNETMAESVVKDASGNPVDLYALVDEDEWTWEKMKEYTKLVSTTSGIEQYGLLCNSHSSRSLLTAFDGEICVASGEGSDITYSYPEAPSERTATMLNDAANFFNSEQGKSVMHRDNTGTDAAYLDPIFNRGAALFYTQTLDSIYSIGAEMQSPNRYGILPFPKYDDIQTEYYTPLRDSLSGVCVPRTVDARDKEMVGVVTEALCMYGYQKIRPEYLNNVVSGRYLTDDNMKGVLDILRKNLAVKFEMTLGADGGFPYSTIDSMIGGSAKDFTTLYSGSRESWQTKLTNVYTAYEQMES